MKIDKKDLYNKLANLTDADLKRFNISKQERDYITQKLLNDKLGLTINFDEVDEQLEQNYFGFEEISELNINPKDENNHLIIEGDNYYALKALAVAGGVIK